MNLAIEKLKAAVSLADRQVSDARGRLSVAQKQVADETELIEVTTSQIHECNLAIDALRRVAQEEAKPKAAADSKAQKPAEDAEKPAAPGKRQKPEALTSK